jgi:CBS domain-containing protein
MNLEKTRAKQIMSKIVVALDMSMSLREALDVLSDEKITGAPVVDEDRRPVGVISISDIVGYEVGKIRSREPRRALYYSIADFEGAEEIGDLEDEELPEEVLDRATVAQAMTPMVMTVSPESSLVQIARVMAKERIHRVIVTEAFKIVGLVSSMDILKAITRPSLKLAGKES